MVVASDERLRLVAFHGVGLRGAAIEKSWGEGAQTKSFAIVAVAHEAHIGWDVEKVMLCTCTELLPVPKLCQNFEACFDIKIDLFAIFIFQPFFRPLFCDAKTLRKTFLSFTSSTVGT